VTAAFRARSYYSNYKQTHFVTILCPYPYTYVGGEGSIFPYFSYFIISVYGLSGEK
jgi:hypothetical protein